MLPLNYIYIFPHISYQLNVTGKDHKILCLFIVIFGCDGDHFNISITTILIDSINNKKQKKLSRTTIDLCWPHQRINGIFPFCPIQAPLLLLNSVVCDADSRIVYRIWSIYIDRFFSNFFFMHSIICFSHQHEKWMEWEKKNRSRYFCLVEIYRSFETSFDDELLVWMQFKLVVTVNIIRHSTHIITLHGEFIRSICVMLA